MIMKLQFLPLLSLLVAGSMVGRQQSGDGRSYYFDGHYGQVEVGGRYAGAEFHHSRPIPSRISFYYPVANSIDLSTDYWKRDVSLPMAIGVKIGNAGRRWIGKEPWSYTVSPHKVLFERSEGEIQYSLKYEFCLNEPAMVFSLTIKNFSTHVVPLEIYTHLVTCLRTCQTYARKDSALTSYHDSLQMIETDFEDPQTDRASVFVENVGAVPLSWTASAEDLSPTDTGSSTWISSTNTLRSQTHSVSKGNPVAAYEYQQALAPGDSLPVIQIIGSCRRNEIPQIASRLKSSWKENVFAYDELVRLQSEEQSHFVTGDEWLDHSTVYAKGILAANAHTIDTKIVPMPCPAEYNFFFTHDVLMTDLAAVNFDLPRVKNDLLYVASHSEDNIIPHAYYWRDDGYKTEYCTPDNWNHFWFILLTGSYLRHSLDDSTGQRLFPLVTKSLVEVLTQVKSDHLMYAFRPDWWDIGHVEGPRAYTTALTIRALREYLFISSYLNRRSPKLREYETLADSMQQAMNDHLWDESTNFLINYNEGKKDEHYYMGSLLAVAYDLLNPEKAGRLLETAGDRLMAESIGIRTVMPPDFQTEQAISSYKFHGDEAGQPYLYINGGVWPHCNAWYALSLIAAGKTEEALKFVKSKMTVDGIIHSPMGQPALYEYRYTDPLSMEYGRIDKPSFLWAGGFYLKTLYALFGVRENVWNISFEGPIHTEKDDVRYSLQFGNLKSVEISGNNKLLKSIAFGNKPVPSAILPLDRGESEKDVTVTFGGIPDSYLSSINAMLLDASLDKSGKGSTYRILSFNGHHTTATMISSRKIKDAKLDGTTIKNIQANLISEGLTEYKITFTGSEKSQNLQILFE